eukprot:CAMPEP_0184509224 /NCGR_PEP_ID=MMETSP0198_2-20121128/1173_1 /TAXON_ID=1112570 /ORGANISM="Thraustochytrium sp., Strain LLF1b" /LENGTH=200 /DNA_ID=CAMNT_0026899047 /DNA_START=62 /DNA_END=665 /DNA_ORIENTATION=+
MPTVQAPGKPFPERLGGANRELLVSTNFGPGPPVRELLEAFCSCARRESFVLSLAAVPSIWAYGFIQLIGNTQTAHDGSFFLHLGQQGKVSFRRPIRLEALVIKVVSSSSVERVIEEEQCWQTTYNDGSREVCESPIAPSIVAEVRPASGPPLVSFGCTSETGTAVDKLCAGRALRLRDAMATSNRARSCQSRQTFSNSR